MPETDTIPEHWTSQLSAEGEVYPFIDDEHNNITGPGHQDAAAFAEAVNRYDEELDGSRPEPEWTADDIGHRWVLIDPDGERMWIKEPGTDKFIGPDTPGAVAVTTLWSRG